VGGDFEARSRVGRGAVLTLDGLRSLNSQARPDVVFVRLTPGADSAAATHEIEQTLGGATSGFSQPFDVVNVARVDRVPLALAALVALMAAAALVHLLVSAVRARRYELAVLMTLGFTRRQVRSAIGWQATALTTFALLVGVPIGLVVGRSAWRRFAERLGVLPEPVTSWWTVAIVGVAALVLANAVAIGPAWFAARTRPATVLRSE
jgi:predicted lysophospholipase L1 biosynthesis ABC-type transport system permease subunit